LAGLHFFNPATIMQLFEVIKGAYIKNIQLNLYIYKCFWKENLSSILLLCPFLFYYSMSIIYCNYIFWIWSA
jgi:hypothetical protein